MSHVTVRPCELLDLGGLKARRWVGVSAQGVRVELFVVALRIDAGEGEEWASEFPESVEIAPNPADPKHHPIIPQQPVQHTIECRREEGAG